MSDKEKAIKLLDYIPEGKMSYILGILEGAAIPDETPNKTTIAAFEEGEQLLADSNAKRYSNIDDLFAALEEN